MGCGSSTAAIAADPLPRGRASEDSASVLRVEAPPGARPRKLSSSVLNAAHVPMNTFLRADSADVVAPGDRSLGDHSLQHFSMQEEFALTELEALSATVSGRLSRSFRRLAESHPGVHSSGHAPNAAASNASLADSGYGTAAGGDASHDGSHDGPVMRRAHSDGVPPLGLGSISRPGSRSGAGSALHAGSGSLSFLDAPPLALHERRIFTVAVGGRDTLILDGRGRAFSSESQSVADIPAMVGALARPGATPEEAMPIGVALMGMLLDGAAPRRAAMRPMHEAGVLPVAFAWLKALAPGSVPPGGDADAWRAMLMPVTFLWDIPEVTADYGQGLESAGHSLDAALAACLGETGDSSPCSSPATESHALTIVGLFAQSAPHRAVVLSDPRYPRRLASLLVESLATGADGDPGLTQPPSYALLSLALTLRACSPKQAGGLYAAVTAALPGGTEPGWGSHRGGLAGLLLTATSRLDWTTPHRGWAFSALKQLVHVDWASAGLAHPGPVVESLQDPAAWAPFFDFAALGQWASRAFLPAVLAAALRCASPESQAALCEELLGQLTKPSLYDEAAALASSVLAASMSALADGPATQCELALLALLRGPDSEDGRQFGSRHALALAASADASDAVAALKLLPAIPESGVAAKRGRADAPLHARAPIVALAASGRPRRLALCAELAAMAQDELDASGVRAATALYHIASLVSPCPVAELADSGALRAMAIVAQAPEDSYEMAGVAAAVLLRVASAGPGAARAVAVAGGEAAAAAVVAYAPDAPHEMAWVGEMAAALQAKLAKTAAGGDAGGGEDAGGDQG